MSRLGGLGLSARPSPVGGKGRLVNVDRWWYDVCMCSVTRSGALCCARTLEAGLLCLCALSVGSGVTAAPQLVPVRLDLAAEWRDQFEELQQRIAARQEAAAALKGALSKTPARIEAEAFRRDALIHERDRHPADVVLRQVAALLTHLETELGVDPQLAQRRRLHSLMAAGERTLQADGSARYRLYTSACRLRREVALANPLLDFDKILFAKHHRSKADHMCDQYFGFNARPGGGIYILHDPFGPEPRLQNVLADVVVANGRLAGSRLKSGSFISPELSFDARTILFAYTEAGPRSLYRNHDGGWGRPESCFHVFRVGVDGAELRQLTDGGWNDFDPCFLPNGRIVFISERRGGFGRCHGRRHVPTYTLHTMNSDGSDLVPLSFHETNEWHPSVANDGRIIYTRWDYVDRGSNEAHHPWAVMPDGRNPRAIHGNYRFEGKVWPSRARMELDYRAIPGSTRFVATAAAHHGQAYGSLIVLDTALGETETESQLRRLTPDVPWPENESPWREAYGTAWPLSEDHHLCVYARVPSKEAMRAARKAGQKAPAYPPYKLYLLDSFGNKVLLYADPDIACLGPIPVRPRPIPPVLPHLTDVGRPPALGHRAGRSPQAQDVNRPYPVSPRPAQGETGVFACVNVYDGLLPWPEGTKISALRIVQVYPFAIAHGNFIGCINMSMARSVLGTVPVETDGSAHFVAPAGKVLYFQALDGNGLAVQSMKSAAYVAPGERLVCQGCHERRYGTPRSPAQPPLALGRPPSRIQPEIPEAHPITFPRLVQPVLDRHCVACHQKEPEAPDLTRRPARADRPLGPPASYSNLVPHVWGPRGTRSIPGKVGARHSRLYRLLTGDHYGLTLPKEDFRRLALWIDCNSNLFGAYRAREAQLAGKAVRPAVE